jgi:hypothetical protein
MTKLQTKSARSPLALALGLALLGGAPAWAASDYLLEIEGVKGESKAVEVSGFSFSGGAPSRSCRGASGPGEATFSRPPAGVVVLAAAPTPQHFPKAVLHVRKAGGDSSAVTLENVMITSVAGGPARGPRPMKLSYARASWTAKDCLAAR